MTAVKQLPQDEDRGGQPLGYGSQNGDLGVVPRKGSDPADRGDEVIRPLTSSGPGSTGRDGEALIRVRSACGLTTALPRPSVGAGQFL